MSEMEKILVIDDDESIRKTLAMVLEREGYQVDTAQNGTVAIEKSQGNFYNLALIDIRLPDMEGTRLLTELQETTPRMVKILLTGNPTVDNAITAVNKNADAYLTKPVNLDQLLQTVREQLRRQQEERKYSEGKVAEFFETRFKEMDSTEEW
jgi:DNA-binding NtrC family response regulator